MQQMFGTANHYCQQSECSEGWWSANSVCWILHLHNNAWGPQNGATSIWGWWRGKPL